MDYKETQKYLDSFVNYEMKSFFPYKKSLKLERVRNLLFHLNIPYQDLNVIHVAGTKGKGSVATFCASILAASGYKVGIYTSPHFFDFRERIKIAEAGASDMAGTLISRRDVIRITQEFKPHLERLRNTSRWGTLTFFEVYTALACKYFLEKKLDCVIFETGLGGRLDATNVVTPWIALITHIGYDHTEKLGRRLRDIAFEKAGIIKKECPVISSFQKKAALAEIIKKAKAAHAPLFLLGRDFTFHNIRVHTHYTLFDFSFDKVRINNLKIRMKGIYQVENAALALASIVVLKKAGKINTHSALKRGLVHSFVEGRFEIVCKDPLVVVDIAHNPLSFSVLSDTLNIYFPRKEIIFIFAASKDKDIKNMVNKIKYTKIIFTSFNTPRSFSPEDIKRITRLQEAACIAWLKEAFELGLKLYGKNSLILIAGSFFLAAEMKRLLKRKRIAVSD